MATLVERGIYGFGKAGSYGSILDRGDAFLLYKPTSINSFLRKIGVEVKKLPHIALSNTKSEQLYYPKHPNHRIQS